MTFYLFAAVYLTGMYALGAMIGGFIGLGRGGGGTNDFDWYGPGPFSDDSGGGIEPDREPAGSLQ